jgi:hypothetical protein
MLFDFEKSLRTLFTFFFMVCVAALVAGESHAQLAASGDANPTAALSGYWKVTEVNPASGAVKAPNSTDPAYVGAILEVSKDWMAWRPHKGGGNLSDVCMAPHVLQGALQCSYGSFGPKGARLTLENGRLLLDWYDDTKLVLQRVD